MLIRLLARVARRCPVHDRASYPTISRLERELGMRLSPPPTSLVDAYCNPALITCGYTWCRTRSP